MCVAPRKRERNRERVREEGDFVGLWPETFGLFSVVSNESRVDGLEVSRFNVWFLFTWGEDD